MREGYGWLDQATERDAQNQDEPEAGPEGGGGGAWMAGATLLIAKPINSSSNDDGARQPPIEADAEEDEKHVELALEAFGGGVYAEAVRDLARCRHGYCHLNIPF